MAKRRDTGQVAVIAEAIDKSIACSLGQTCCGKQLFFVHGTSGVAEIKNGQRRVRVDALDVPTGEGNRCASLVEGEACLRGLLEAGKQLAGDKSSGAVIQCNIEGAFALVGQGIKDRAIIEIGDVIEGVDHVSVDRIDQILLIEGAPRKKSSGLNRLA